MKKKILIFVIFSFVLAAGAAEQKVYEFSMEPEHILLDFDMRLQNYWRFPEKDAQKMLTPELNALLKSFQDGIAQLRQVLKLSGVRDIEEISGKSVKVSNDTGDFYFRNTAEIEYDEKSTGFLAALLKKLPPEKVVKDTVNDGMNDLHFITDDTVCAFSLPLNFEEAAKTLAADSALYSRLDAWIKDFSGMTLTEFATCVTGEWGGLINFKKMPGRRNNDNLFEFMLIIPDLDKKIFSKIGEYLSVRKMAQFKDNILHVRMAKYNDIMIMPVDNYMVVVSSADFFRRIDEHSKQKKICSKIKKLEIPADFDRDCNSYFYRGRDFISLLNTIFVSRSLPFGFMTGFTGNDSFSMFYADSGEIEIKQYSTAAMTDIAVLPYRIDMMVHYDNMIFRNGRREYFRKLEEIQSRKCLEDMKLIAEKLRLYAEKNGGRYPDGLNQNGLQKLIDFAGLDRKLFSAADGRSGELPFKRFYYWGGNAGSSGGNMVLLSDRGGIHQKHIHVLFCDGSIREFELENVRSAQRIAGFLHSMFHYEQAVFKKLMKQADALDSQKL